MELGVESWELGVQCGSVPGQQRGVAVQRADVSLEGIQLAVECFLLGFRRNGLAFEALDRDAHLPAVAARMGEAELEREGVRAWKGAR
ncbi:MAG: hypothetical protein ACO1QR_05625 [Chthoniobacteraceae bacterium]